MKRRILWAALGAFMTLNAPALAQHSYDNPHLLMSAKGLEDALQASGQSTGAGSLIVVDVRPLEDFEAGHIPGALHLAPQAVDDPDAPVAGALRPQPELVAIMRSLGVGKDQQLVFYDDKGGFHAARMFWLAEYLGHRRVALLNGGVQAWERVGQLSTAQSPGVAPGSFAALVTPRRQATADYVVAHLHDPETVVVDVRPAKAYAEGHIPGALSLPWKANLADDLTFKQVEDLRKQFEDAGVTRDRNVVNHCQTGLASAHSYAALRLMGYPRVRVYDRSWAEWGSADDLPKDTGS